MYISNVQNIWLFFHVLEWEYFQCEKPKLKDLRALSIFWDDLLWDLTLIKNNFHTLHFTNDKFRLLDCCKFWNDFYWTKNEKNVTNSTAKRLNFNVVSFTGTMGEEENLKI